MDRSIPFYNIIMKCEEYHPVNYVIPEGFYVREYHPGDESAWAELEYEIGDFDSKYEAEQYFVEKYCTDIDELKSRCLFAVNGEGKAVGSCIAWRDKKGSTEAASLHWLVVSQAYRGRGIGKALCSETMSRFYKMNEFPVYIHTQPWSYKAVLLYIAQGFKIQKSDTFAEYENQYSSAVGVLKDILTPGQYDRIILNSEL